MSALVLSEMRSETLVRNTVTALASFFSSGERYVRTFGAEMEQMVVDADGHAVPIDEMMNAMEAAGWMACRAPTGEVIGYFEPATGTRCVGEAGAAIERNIPFFHSLHEMEACIRKSGEALRALFQEYGWRLLHYGMSPFMKPDDVPWLNNPRYTVLQATAPPGLDEIKTAASIQVHVSVHIENCIDVLNMLTYVSPLITALTANASIAQGEIRDGVVDYREYIYRLFDDPDRARSGIIKWFTDLEDYARWVLSRRYLFDPELRPIGKPLGEYLLAEGKLSSEEIKLHLLSHMKCLWPVARLTEFGTVEFRPVGKQLSTDEDMAVIALVAGLVENYQGVLAFIEECGLRQRAPTLRELALSGHFPTEDQGSLLSLVRLARKGLPSEDKHFLTPLAAIASGCYAPPYKRAEEMFRRYGQEQFLTFLAKDQPRYLI